MSTNNQQLTYYQRNTDTILRKAKEYYEKNKEKRREYGRKRYRNMSAEEKDKINEYKRYEYSMLSEEIKNKKRERETNRYYLIKAGKYL